MPSIHAETPGRAGGLGGGFDLTYQLTVKAARDLLRALVDRDQVARGLERLADLDADFYRRNNLLGYTMQVGAMGVGVRATPRQAILEIPLTLRTPASEVFTGTAAIPVPILEVSRDDGPHVVLAFSQIQRPQVTLAYQGPRAQDVLTDLSDRHAWGLILGLMMAGNTEIGPTNQDFHRTGLHAFQQRVAVFEATDSLRTVLSVRTAFCDHQDLILGQLAQDLEEQGPVMSSGGIIREEEGGETRRFEIVMEDGVGVRRSLSRVLVDLRGRVRTEQREHTLKLSVPMGVHEGKLVVDFSAVTTAEVNLSPTSRELEQRVLADITSRSPFPVDLVPFRLAGVCAVVADRRSWIRLFAHTESVRGANDRNHVSAADELALVIDRRLAAGLAWDGMAAANPAMDREHDVRFERMKTGFSEDGVTVDAWLKLGDWPDPAWVGGYMGLLLQTPTTGGSCKTLAMEPHLTGHPPPTMMAFAPLLLGLVGGALAPVVGIVLFGLGALAVAFSPLIIGGVGGSGVGDQGAGIGNAFNVEFHGFRLCVGRLQVEKGGFVLGGKFVQVVGTSSQPLTVTGRQTRNGRTVGYRLSSGQVLPMRELVTLMQAGLRIQGVHLVYGRTGTWLRGDPDAEGANNLSSMPQV